MQFVVTMCSARIHLERQLWCGAKHKLDDCCFLFRFNESKILSCFSFMQFVITKCSAMINLLEKENYRIGHEEMKSTITVSKDLI